MAVATSLAFLLVGTAVATLGGRRDRWRGIRAACAGAAHVLAVAALLGYATGVASLYAVPGFSSIALPTAAAHAVLSAAAVLARPDDGILRVIVSDTAGGVVARRLLPAIPVALAVLGGANLVGLRLAWYDDAFALAMMTLVGGVVATALVARQSLHLHRVDLVRRAAEDHVRALNDSLECRVSERTRELEQALERVRTLEGLIPMCAWCRRIDAGDKRWLSVEDYISGSTRARVTHGMCADCLAAAESREGAETGPGP